MAASKKFKIVGGKHREVLLPVLEDIFAKNGSIDGVEEELVRVSTPKSSPTHHLFEWDDGKAGHEWRLHIARNYIASFDIVFEDSTEPVRAFPNVVIDGKNTYVPLQRVLGDKDLTKQVIEEALKQARAWAARYEAYRHIAPLSSVFSAIDRASKKRGKKKAA